MRQKFRELERLAAKYHRRLQHTSGGHYAFICIYGRRRTVFAAGTPSDYRWLKNTESKLKRTEHTTQAG